MPSRVSKAKAPSAASSADLWKQLPSEIQLQVLTRLCRNRSKLLKQEFPEVLSVGVGHKMTAGERLSTLCLGFLVLHKADSGKQLPQTIRTTIKIDGRGRQVYVPTDVEELADSGPHLATNAATGILVVSASESAIRGTGAVCCLVRAQGQPDLFALSCHHVLTLSPKVGGCHIVIDALASDRQGVPFGQLFEAVPMAPQQPSQIDAALARIEVGSTVRWVHSGMQPSSVDMGLSEPQDCTIYAPGRLVNAVYVKTWPEVQLPYPGCGDVQIVCAYQFQAATQPGDSGSPVIGVDGTLYGMHFWGSPFSNFAMAIPAGYLFGPGVFHVGTLELA
ncbi:hypothetical protein [Delftia sp.]|uniref:hypothetical protein n=1 Tax=Delftia sp. TaxID=1886637 RepID=UPI00257FC7FB|nr:hypothetical protein [Delftia sp.]MPT54556.1 hypothetical protein [Delftia sp.]